MDEYKMDSLRNYDKFSAVGCNTEVNKKSSGLQSI